MFFTGSSSVPPLGFESVPAVNFLHSSEDRFCKSSTCDLKLKIPTRYGDDYPAFREAMVMSLVDNDGFGGV